MQKQLELPRPIPRNSRIVPDFPESIEILPVKFSSKFIQVQEFNCLCNFPGWFENGLVANPSHVDAQRTSDSLNEGLPIKTADKSFKETDSFSIKKLVGSTLE